MKSKTKLTAIAASAILVAVVVVSAGPDVLPPPQYTPPPTPDVATPPAPTTAEMPMRVEVTPPELPTETPTPKPKTYDISKFRFPHMYDPKTGKPKKDIGARYLGRNGCASTKRIKMKLNDYDSIIYLTPLGELPSRYYIYSRELLEQLQAAGRAPVVVTWMKAKEIHVQLQIVGLTDKALPIQVHDVDDDHQEILIDIELDPITPPSNIPMDEQGQKDWYLR